MQQAQTLHEQLLQQLREVEAVPALTSAQRREQSLQQIRQAITALKELVLSHPFADEQEEIYFFKHLKPRFTSLFILHSRLALIELNKPMGNRKHLRRYYEHELLLIRNYYEHHLQLHQYMASEATFLDSQLFVRGKAELPYHYSCSATDSDTRFTTHYDYVVARLQANRQLADWLLQAIQELEHRKVAGSSSQQRRKVAWTGSKVHLVELAYALCESGQINNGVVGLMEVTEQLEYLFQVKLGNVSRAFQEVRQRKKDSRTKFLDLLKERLLHRMETLDG